MKIRKIQQNPPYTFVSTLTISSNSEDLAEEYIIKTMELVSQNSNGAVVVIGPTKPYVYKDTFVSFVKENIKVDVNE